MPISTVSLCPGVQGVYLENHSFHTTLVSVNFYLPHRRESAAPLALLSSLLVGCCQKYPDYLELNRALSALYGADISSAVQKNGDRLCLRFYASVINDTHAFAGEKPVWETARLLLSMLFEPRVRNQAFFAEDVNREKRKLLEHIDGEINEKRIYAQKRLIEEMFRNDPYGVPRYGSRESVERLTGEELYRAWQELISSARVSVNVIGPDSPKSLFEAVRERFLAVDRVPVADLSTLPAAACEEVRTVSETMQVAQGKMVMGFTCRAGDDDETLATLAAVDIFGGGPYSRLFQYVREKQSLCYYCSASAVRSKGFLTVACGIEAENVERAKEEILKQLDDMKNGRFTDFELASSLKNTADTLKTYNDSPGALDAYYSSKAFSGRVYSPAELSGKIAALTREEIRKAAEEIRLHTVYELLPQEEEK